MRTGAEGDDMVVLAWTAERTVDGVEGEVVL